MTRSGGRWGIRPEVAARLGAAVLLALAFAVLACGGPTGTPDDDSETTREDGDLGQDDRGDVLDAMESAEDVADGADRWPSVDGFVEGDGAEYDWTGPDGTADAGDCRPLLGGPCEIVEQCGCDPGQRCVLDYSGGGRPIEKCVAVGTDPFGAPCDDGVDNCETGSECFGFGEIICSPFCYSDHDCPGGWDCSCGPTGLTPDDDYRVCCQPPIRCDPFTAEGCPDGDACVAGWGMGDGCVPAGTAEAGESCVPASGEYCVVGFECHGFGVDLDTRVCTKYCRLDGGLPDCADVPGTVCAAGTGDPVVGLCLLPE
jgi:hypothetical protein